MQAANPTSLCSPTYPTMALHKPVTIFTSFESGRAISTNSPPQLYSTKPSQPFFPLQHATCPNYRPSMPPAPSWPISKRNPILTPTTFRWPSRFRIKLGSHASVTFGIWRVEAFPTACYGNQKHVFLEYKLERYHYANHFWPGPLLDWNTAKC